MTPELADSLHYAESCLQDAKTTQPFVPRMAAREAYTAAYHAAEAYVFHRTGKIAKTHSGLRSEFGRLAKDEPRMTSEFTRFLANAYELKSQADYNTKPETPITAQAADDAIRTTERFIALIKTLLDEPAPPSNS
jgi:uncharacterized protein (UPF0332 family)